MDSGHRIDQLTLPPMDEVRRLQEENSCYAEMIAYLKNGDLHLPVVSSSGEQAISGH